MLDYPTLWACLDEIGLASWRAQLEATIPQRMSDKTHGDYSRWANTIEALRSTPGDDAQTIRDLLLTLAPWRKGPFDVAGITIDSEWRSDIKWNRLKDAIAPLHGRSVLDVGAGNGYYALRMRDAGATSVIGIDPMLLYVVQFLAILHFLGTKSVFVLPLRLEELPEKCHAFDTCFSMGVLYHQNFSLPHLAQLKETLRPGGELVLETLYLPGDFPHATRPPKRYARMRNIGLLPTIPKLTNWLQMVGFEDIQIIDKSVTTADEQRTTEWMTFESLRESLDPNDAGRTVEGLPAPRRVIVLANAP